MNPGVWPASVSRSICLGERLAAGVDLEDLLAALAVGAVDDDLAVEAAGPQQRRVEDVGPVGGGDQDDVVLHLEAVHLEMKDNIIFIAATNRPDILDPALLRPGRFDRQIVVDRPDRKGRKRILEVHTRGKPLAKVIDLDVLAGQTPGFTGADLANLINEAALLTARSNKREITMQELEEGIMRVIAGPEKKSRVMSEKERLVTAYHELGHAIVGHLLPNTDPVHKISIISRGQALGYTISLPTEDKFLTTRAELTDTMAMTLGGRAAEEIIFSEITTGASNDLEKVTETAKQMVMRFGMSERLGPRVFGHDRSQPFLGREFSSEPDYSDEIAREIDDEIRRIVEEAHQTAKDILVERRRSCDDLQDPARARDDRRRGVREAARRRRRGRGLRGRGGGDAARTSPGEPESRPAARAHARCRIRARASPADRGDARRQAEPAGPSRGAGHGYSGPVCGSRSVESGLTPMTLGWFVANAARRCLNGQRCDAGRLVPPKNLSRLSADAGARASIRTGYWGAMKHSTSLCRRPTAPAQHTTGSV